MSFNSVKCHAACGDTLVEVNDDADSKEEPAHRSPRSAARQRWLADYKAFTYAKRTILELDSSYSGPAPRSTDIPAALRELEARMIAAADPEGRE